MSVDAHCGLLTCDAGAPYEDDPRVSSLSAVTWFLQHLSVDDFQISSSRFPWWGVFFPLSLCYTHSFPVACWAQQSCQEPELEANLNAVHLRSFQCPQFDQRLCPRSRPMVQPLASSAAPTFLAWYSEPSGVLDSSHMSVLPFSGCTNSRWTPSFSCLLQPVVRCPACDRMCCGLEPPVFPSLALSFSIGHYRVQASVLQHHTLLPEALPHVSLPLSPDRNTSLLGTPRGRERELDLLLLVIFSFLP